MNINTTQMPGGSFWGGSPATVGQVNRFGQQQQGGMSEILRMALSGISGDAGKQFDFAPIAQKARSQFQQNTLPSLAERFTSMGSGSSLGSPAFANQFSQAGAGLEEGLASQEAGFGMQQHQQQQQMLMQLFCGVIPRPKSCINICCCC